VRRVSIILVLVLCLSACTAATPKLQPVRATGEELQLYLRPLSGDARRLTFRIAEIRAMAEDGNSVPLELELSEIGESTRRERLLGSARLPRGRYSGLAVRIESASLDGTALLVEERSVPVEAPFVVRRDSIALLTMQLEPGSADRYSFHPLFSAMVPVEAPHGVIGVSSNRGGDSITLFDKLTGRVTRAVRTARQPTGVALGPAGRQAYVAAYDENAIQTIDLQAFEVINRLQLNGGDRPLELALTPDGRTLLSVNHGSDSVSFIDAAVLVETDRVTVGRRPVSILLNHAGSRAFIFDSLSDTITILDVARRERIATIATEAKPVRGQLSRSGERLYVIHRSSPNMLVFDTTTFSLLQRIRVGTGATAIRVDPQTDRIHIARRGAREVSIYDPFTLLPIDSIEVKGEVIYIGLDDESRNLLLVLADSRRVLIVQLTGSRTVAEIDVGESPFWAATVGER